jgi:hypothetical protein
MLGCEPSVRNDGTMVPVIFAGMWCSERNQIVGSEAREWLATRTDKPKSIYATVARRVHTNLTADESNELSQFWLGHHAWASSSKAPASYFSTQTRIN